MEELRSIKNVVRHGRVRRIEASQIDLEDCAVVTGTQQVYVGCTAEGLRTMVPDPSMSLVAFPISR